MKLIIISVLTICSPLLLFAEKKLFPDTLPDHLETSTWIERGEGTFSRFGFHIYDAKFWSSTQSNNPPYILHITYQRNIKSSKIIEASLKELTRQTHNPKQLKQWKQYLLNAIPTVEKGDTLSGVHNGNSASFYLNGSYIITIKDKVFADNFFGIWLYKNTSEPSLRRKLIGTP